MTATERGSDRTPDGRVFVIDSDTGVDDAWAFAHGLLTPDLDIVAITTVFGNSDVDSCTANALELVELAGRSVPVYRGAPEPLISGCGPAPQVHGPTGRGGLGPAQPSTTAAPGRAANRILELVEEHGESLTIVAMGRLTNIALACALDPVLMRTLGQVLWMGGAIAVSGNTTPTAEANLDGDPEALQVLLSHRIPLTVLPLDVTIDVRLTEAELEEQRRNTHPAVRQACAVTPYYMDFYESILGVRECAMHCGLLLGLAMDPTLVREARHLPVAVELGGKHTRGMMVTDRRAARRLDGPPATEDRTLPRIILDVDGDRYKRQLFQALADADPARR